MATIVLFPLPEMGHANATIGLAKRLRDAGHEVVYAGPEDLRARLEGEGFHYLPMWTDVLPVGWFKAHAELLNRLSPRLAPAHLSEWEDIALKRTLHGDVVRDVLNALRPDLALVDEHHFLATHLIAAGARVVRICTAFPNVRRTDRPPVTCAQIPDPSLISRVRVNLEWGRHNAGRLRGKIEETLARRRLGHFAGRKPKSRFTKRDVARWVSAPTLVLAPSELDLPSRPLPGSFHWVGACLDVDRAEEPFDWGRYKVGAERPFVYCAFGSQSHRLHRCLRVFAVLNDTARRLPGWDFLVVSGGFDVSQVGPPPPNLRVIAFGPQLAALRRADVMLNHGGLNTVKECLAADVPMFVIPMGYDQPTNAARVEHFGLGLRATYSRVTLAELVEGLRRLVDDASYRQRIAAFNERTAYYDANALPARTVAKLLAKH